MPKQSLKPIMSVTTIPDPTQGNLFPSLALDQGLMAQTIGAGPGHTHPTIKIILDPRKREIGTEVDLSTREIIPTRRLQSLRRRTRREKNGKKIYTS